MQADQQSPTFFLEAQSDYISHAPLQLVPKYDWVWLMGWR